jgi:hypothetical protein
LSNDIAHVKKITDKLKQQIAQAEIEGGNFGKRKRRGLSVAKGSENRPVKIPKHKKTGVLDSQDDGAAKLAAEGGLQIRLATMQGMFSSTWPVSLLNLRGDNQNDADLCPTFFSGETQNNNRELLTRQSSCTSMPSIDTMSPTLNILSSTPSGNFVNSPQFFKRQQSTFRRPSLSDDYRHGSMDWSSISRRGSESQPLTEQKALSTQPVKIKKGLDGGLNTANEWIEAVDVDVTYRAPSDRPAKPVACFYVRLRATTSQNDGGYYRAVYLAQRTVKGLLNGISKTFQVDLTRIIQVVRVTLNGLKVIVDNDVINELPEGQDMVVEFDGLRPNPLASKVDVDTNVVDGLTSSGLEVMLLF